MTQHSDIIGGSSASRRINCPGSYKLEQRMPGGGTSEHAERGTALHHAMEHYLNEIEPQGGEIVDIVGMEFNGYTIDADMLDNKLLPAVAAFDEVEDLYSIEHFLIEQQVQVTPVPGAFGTIDILADGKRVVVLDWKFGDGVMVSPVSNHQLAFYAAGALHDPDPRVRELVKDAEEFALVIVQPKADGKDYAVWETDRLWLDTYVDVLVSAHEKMSMDHPPLKAGAHCRWCRAQPICPLQRANVASLTQTIDPREMDAVALAGTMDKIEIAKKYIEKFERYLHSELERGVKVPGYKLVPKRGQRVYDDPEEAEKILKARLGAAGAFDKKLITPAAAERKLGVKKYEKYLANHVSVVSSGTTVAPDTDSRPDVSNPSSSLADKLRKTMGGPVASN